MDPPKRSALRSARLHLLRLDAGGGCRAGLRARSEQLHREAVVDHPPHRDRRLHQQMARAAPTASGGDAWSAGGEGVSRALGAGTGSGAELTSNCCQAISTAERAENAQKVDLGAIRVQRSAVKNC